MPVPLSFPFFDTLFLSPSIVKPHRHFLPLPNQKKINMKTLSKEEEEEEEQVKNMSCPVLCRAVIYLCNSSRPQKCVQR